MASPIRTPRVDVPRVGAVADPAARDSLSEVWKRLQQVIDRLDVQRRDHTSLALSVDALTTAQANLEQNVADNTAAVRRGATLTSPGGGGSTPPAGACEPDRPDQTTVVTDVKNAQVAAGNLFTTNCEIFEITKGVVQSLQASADTSVNGAGFLIKPSGENICNTWSISRVCFPDGGIYKILSDAGVGGANGPEWVFDGCVDPSRYQHDAA